MAEGQPFGVPELHGGISSRFIEGAALLHFPGPWQLAVLCSTPFSVFAVCGQSGISLRMLNCPAAQFFDFYAGHNLLVMKSTLEFSCLMNFGAFTRPPVS